MWSPFGQLPTNGTASWKSGPNERGTLSILTTCLITLALCVYSTLHLNIPEHGKTKWTHLAKRKVGWLCVGILAPEVIAYIALNDWLLSKTFERRMKGFLTCERTSPESTQDAAITNATARRRFPWTQVHSYYALMGGYVFDTSGVATNFFPDGRTRLTLTLQALLKIAELQPDLIPDLSKGNIQDKSKADGLAKTIVCLQAVWFLAQSVGRLATGNPISLLEMNTLLHVMCSLAIYVAWWHKLLDIEEPSLVDMSSTENKQLAAWMLMGSAIGRNHCQYPKLKQGTFGFRVNAHLSLAEDCETNYQMSDGDLRYAKYVISKRTHIHPLVVDPDQCHVDPATGTLTVHFGQGIFGYRLCSHGPIPAVEPHALFIKLKASDIECLKLASAFRQRHDPNGPWSPTLHKKRFLVRWASLDTSNDASIAEILQRWPFSTLDEGDTSTVFLVALAAAGSFYGGLHLLAWNAPFPTRAEKMLWRIAGITIAAPFPIMIATFGSMTLGAYFYNTWFWLVSSKMHHKLLLSPAYALHAGFVSMFKRVCKNCPMRYVKKITGTVGKALAKTKHLLIVPYVVYALLFFSTLLYVAARVYVVVECFINLAHLPEAVYKEPDWSKVFPHLGSG